MRLQLHGHLRIEPRWLPLPAPLRDVYNQKPPPSAPTGDELVPRFVGFEGVNAACIFFGGVIGGIITVLRSYRARAHGRVLAWCGPRGWWRRR